MIILKSLHLGLLLYFILLGVEVQGVKSWLATRGHSKEEPASLQRCLSSAAHLTSSSQMNHVTEVIRNTFCHEYATAHMLLQLTKCFRPEYLCSGTSKTTPYVKVKEKKAMTGWIKDWEECTSLWFHYLLHKTVMHRLSLCSPCSRFHLSWTVD